MHNEWSYNMKQGIAGRSSIIAESSPPACQPGLDPIPVVHCRSDIEMESHVELILWIRSTSVEIDNVSDICPASID